MHLGVIPDGHRRYAEENNISNKKSYLKSQERINDIITKIEDKSLNIPNNIKINEITVYGLSEKNLHRDEKELDIFYDCISVYLKNIIDDEYLENNIHPIFGRDLSFKLHDTNLEFITTKEEAIPNNIKKLIKKAENKYNGNGLQINILLAYNGKKEIINSVKKCEDVSKESIKENLNIPSNIDYIIRTGKSSRRECLSGFPIWQSSYAEYYHLKKNFPAVTIKDVEKAINHYNKLRKKNGR